MHNDALTPHGVRNPDNLLLREDHAREGVLEGDELGGGRVDILAKDGVVDDFLQSEVVAVLGGYGVRSRLRVEGHSAGFVQVDVGARVEDDRVRGLGQVGADGELVGLVRA